MSPIPQTTITKAFIGNTEKEKINEGHKKINDKMNEIIDSKKEFKTGSQLNVQQEMFLRKTIKENKDNLKMSDYIKYNNLKEKDSIIKDVLFVSLALQYGDEKQKAMALDLYNELRPILEQEGVKDLPGYEEVKPLDISVRQDFNQEGPIKVSSIDIIPWGTVGEDKIPEKILYKNYYGETRNYTLIKEKEGIYRDGNKIPYYKYNEKGTDYTIGLDEIIKLGHFNSEKIGIKLVESQGIKIQGRDPLLIYPEDYDKLSIEHLLNSKQMLIPIKDLEEENRLRLKSHVLRPEIAKMADDCLRDLSKRGLLTDSVRSKFLISLYEVDYMDRAVGYRHNLAKKYIRAVQNLDSQLRDYPNLFARGIDNLKVQIQVKTEQFHEEPNTSPFTNGNVPRIASTLNQGLEEVSKLGKLDFFFFGRRDLLDTFLDMKSMDLVPGAIVQKNIRQEQFNLLSEEEYQEIDRFLLSLLGETYYNNMINQFIGSVSGDVGSGRRFEEGNVNVSTPTSNINYETNVKRVKMLINAALYPDKLSRGISSNIGGTEWYVGTADIEGAIARCFILSQRMNIVSGPGRGGGSAALLGTVEQDTSGYKLDSSGNLIPKKDEKGNIIYQKDKNGSIIKDENGDPIPKYEKAEKKVELERGFGSLHYTAQTRSLKERIIDYADNLKDKEKKDFWSKIKLIYVKKGVPISENEENIKTYDFANINTDKKVFFKYNKEERLFEDIMKDENAFVGFTPDTEDFLREKGLFEEEIPLDIRAGGGKSFDKVTGGFSISSVYMGNYAQLDSSQFAYEKDKETLKIIQKTAAHVFGKEGYSGNFLFTTRHNEKNDDIWTINELYYMDNKGDVFKLLFVDNTILDYFNGFAFGSDSPYAKTSAYTNYQWETDTKGIIAAIDVGDIFDISWKPTAGYQYQEVTTPERFKKEVGSEGKTKTSVIDKENRRKYEEQHTIMFEFKKSGWDTKFAIPMTLGYYNIKENDEEGKERIISKIDYETYGGTLVVKNENNRIILGGKGGVSEMERKDVEEDPTKSDIYDFYGMYDYRNGGLKWGVGGAYHTGAAMENLETTQETYEYLTNLKRVLTRSYIGTDISNHYLGLYFLNALQMSNNPVRDENGDIKYRKDENGKIIYKKDKEGNLIRDKENNPVPIPVTENTEFFFRLAGIYKWNKESNTGIKFDLSRIPGLEDNLKEITRLNDKIGNKEYDMGNLDDDTKKLNESLNELNDTVWKVQSRFVFDENSSRVTIQFDVNEKTKELYEPGVYGLYNHENGFFKIFVQPSSSISKTEINSKLSESEEKSYLLGAGFGVGNAFRLAVSGGAILAADMVTDFKNYDTSKTKLGFEKRTYPTRGGFGSVFIGYSEELIEKTKKIKEVDEIIKGLRENKLPENNNTLNTAFRLMYDEIKDSKKYSDGFKRVVSGQAGLNYLSTYERDLFEKMLSDKISIDLKEFSKRRLHSFGLGAIYLHTRSYSVIDEFRVTGFEEGPAGPLGVGSTNKMPIFGTIPKKTEDNIKNSIEIPFNYSVTNEVDAYVIYRYKWAEYASKKLKTEEHGVALGFETFRGKFATFGELALNYSKTTDKTQQKQIKKKMIDTLATLGFKVKGKELDFSLALQGFLGDTSKFSSSLDDTYVPDNQSLDYGAGLLFSIDF